MSKSKKVVVVGGGVVGLFSALYLSDSGHEVTIVDKNDFVASCSYGNAGLIVPSHIIPMAAPGMIKQGVKWMFDSKSPFYVRPRLSLELLTWGRKFYRSSTKEHVENVKPFLRDFSLLSKELYKELAQESESFLYKEKGLLMLFQSDKVADEELLAARAAKELELEVDFLSEKEVQELEVGTKVKAIGGVHYKSDAHLYPNKLMQYLLKKLKDSKVELIGNACVTDIELINGRILNVRTNTNQVILGDEFVVAAGSWTPEISKKIGKKCSLLPGKGYSFTLEKSVLGPTVPSILCEGKVAVTPMGQDLRFGGTMEITNVRDNKIRSKRLEGIVNTANSFYPELNISVPSEKDTWFGFRPCSPDGVPYVGRVNGISNALLATGHSMMGLSLAPATGKIIDGLISNKKISIDIDFLNPNRKI
ncbi:MAG: FAD-dependent oxidoreductase [Crocinitomicaceae bacterium]|nr:FAD-dependent oxidoreductase [Crocinitomicaceae bacterium]